MSGHNLELAEISLNSQPLQYKLEAPYPVFLGPETWLSKCGAEPITASMV